MDAQKADKHLASFDGGPLDGARLHVSELARAVTLVVGPRRITYVRSTVDSFALDSTHARAPHAWADNVLAADLDGISTVTVALRRSAA